MKTTTIAVATLAFAGLAASASAGTIAPTIVINEVFANPLGLDDGSEYFEIFSTAGVTSLTGLTFLVVEGGGLNAGIIDLALSLDGFSTGTNGLFLWRDSATVLQAAPAAATTQNITDFNPDIENGSQTYLLVTGFTGTIGDDLDTNNDGALDSVPWTSVIDAVGITENSGDITYAASLGFVDFGDSNFTPGAVFRTDNAGWVAAGILGTSPGPFTVNPLSISLATYDASMPYQFTPGNANGSIALVPEPSTGLLLLGSLAGLIGVRRRRA